MVTWERAGGERLRSTPKVSVIVPTYNTGEHIHDLIRSLDGQSMPQDEFEVIFVDDGSTDGTGELLDELSRTHPNWAVGHIPNSGWPGRPRNVGLDAARGEFVAFVDHDDYLDQRGLERVYDFAKRHRSDVIIAREVGVGRSIGRFMFRRTIPDAKLVRDPVIRLLTPHKVYRRAMLQEHGIRFPEGRVRLEDHLFNVQAFFVADRISIYADHPYYYWTRREDARHASSTTTDPHEYFDVAINKILDVVEANTEPGTYRDAIKSHWLEKKALPNLVGARMLAYSPEYRQELFAAVRRLVLERYPEGADVLLSAAARIRAHLLRQGRLDDMVALAHIEEQVTATVAASRVSWADRQAVVHLAIELSYRDGRPVAFRRKGDRILWAPPTELSTAMLPDAVLDVTDEIDHAKVLLLVKRRDAPEDFSVPPQGGVELRADGDGDRLRLVYTGEARFPVDDLLRLHPRPGRFVADYNVEFNVLGWRSTRRVAAPTGQPDPQPYPADPHLADFYTTEMGNLSSRVARPERLPKGPRPPLRSRPAVRRVARAGRHVVRAVRRRLPSGRTAA